jgi:hypothetical protein
VADCQQYGAALDVLTLANSNVDDGTGPRRCEPRDASARSEKARRVLFARIGLSDYEQCGREN